MSYSELSQRVKSLEEENLALSKKVTKFVRYESDTESLRSEARLRRTTRSRKSHSPSRSKRSDYSHTEKLSTSPDSEYDSDKETVYNGSASEIAEPAIREALNFYRYRSKNKSSRAAELKVTKVVKNVKSLFHDKPFDG